MTTWTRAVVDCRCGYCGAHLPIGTPVRVTRLVGVQRPFLRCELCVGEAPPDLPARIETVPTPAPMRPLRLTTKRPLPFDRKLAAVEREVGEEG